MTTPSDDYLKLSRQYAGQVDLELAQEDYPQAGEKAWGSVATVIKALAEQRGWLHNHHDLTDEALKQLADEYGREDLKDYLTFAAELHRNFYEDRLTEGEVLRNINRSKHLRTELETFFQPSAADGRFHPGKQSAKAALGTLDRPPLGRGVGGVAGIRVGDQARFQGRIAGEYGC